MYQVYLTGYEFVPYTNLLRLYLSNNTSLNILLDYNSGRIVKRKKNLVDHTGIRLGLCLETNDYLYIHNHPYAGKAVIVNTQGFSDGKTIYYQDGTCYNTPNEVIAFGLNAVLNGMPYRLLSSNCQHLTNQACYNQNKSHDVEMFVGLGVAALALLLIART